MLFSKTEHIYVILRVNIGVPSLLERTALIVGGQVREEGEDRTVG